MCGGGGREGSCLPPCPPAPSGLGGTAELLRCSAAPQQPKQRPDPPLSSPLPPQMEGGGPDIPAAPSPPAWGPPSTPSPGETAMGRGLQTPHRPACKMFVNQKRWRQTPAGGNLTSPHRRPSSLPVPVVRGNSIPRWRPLMQDI